MHRTPPRPHARTATPTSGPRIAAITALLLLILASPAVLAQDTARRVGTTAAVLGAPTTTTGWVWLEGWITGRLWIDPEREELRRLVRLDIYLQKNRAALHEAALLGTPALRDLSALLRIPPRQLQRALRRDRRAWRAVLTRAPGLARARALAALVAAPVSSEEEARQ